MPAHVTRVSTRLSARDRIPPPGLEGWSRPHEQAHAPPVESCACASCKVDEDTTLDLANDIRSLSEFKRNTVDLLDRLRKTGHPLVLTINGKAELVARKLQLADPNPLRTRTSAPVGPREGRRLP